MPRYEVRIRGPIGPLMQSCLPGLAVVVTAESTLLTGTAAGPDELRALLGMLADNGLPADTVRLKARESAAVTTSNRPTEAS